MRGRSSKNDTKKGMKIDKLSRLNQEPDLSGAYIRSLVKQFNTSRTKESVNLKDRSFSDPGDFSTQNMSEFDQELSGSQQTRQTQQPQPRKKQVRRRLHTSRPYQERLLNMAEARKEIVTALKLHREAVKQANLLQQQKQQEVDTLASMQVSPTRFEQQANMKSTRNPRICPSSTTSFSSYLEDLSYIPLSHPSTPTPPAAYGFSWPTSASYHPVVSKTLNFPSPTQTLGLTLNFHDFKNIDTTHYYGSNNCSSMYSSSSPSSSSSLLLPNAIKEAPSMTKPQEVPSAGPDMTKSFGAGGLHQVMDDEEMAEIRSIGEQYQIEWNDTMNLVMSTWWFKFLKTMEFCPEVKTEDDVYCPFHQVMGFPPWLSTNDGCLHQNISDYCSQDYSHDPSFPCMDRGDVEAVDVDWLA
ncbi:hypothetical protein K2173_017399 [Erythroxylum novogranatense]|uniref:Uncharacterized protein n=1 Tax=Erythroxylum novogranatense TaxID=1862640 RepID=A0AAV8TN05_9ROSI|nr:hypothetical protein K2173_017399 [Erythroxylum novogranatense]